MKIGYRRWSSPIGLSDKETCKISGWLEKRKALLRFLQSRGHQMIMLSKPTKHSAHIYNYEQHKQWESQIDCLFIEMSNHNLFHNYDTVKESVELLARVNCPIYILWDDPELELHIWSSKFNEFFINKDKVVVFTNAENISGNEDELLKAIYYKPHIDIKETVFEFFPIVGLLDYGARNSRAAFFPRKQELVYLGGGSGGRSPKLLAIKEQVPLKIFYHAKNYTFPIDGDAPLQVNRLEFYAEYAANLGIQDKKHDTFGWLTGRGFHALMAGTPTLVEEHSNLAKYFPTYNMQNLAEKFQYVCDNRETVIADSINKIDGLKLQLSLTLSLIHI